MPRVRRPLLALIVLVLALAVGYAVNAAHSGGPTRSTTPAASNSSTATPLSALPPQAAQTVRLIQDGGPFPYPRDDGAVFHNNEQHLPREPDGYYHEYTVPTPGSADRGARRMITGERGEYYYTGDHYQHFVRVEVPQ